MTQSLRYQRSNRYSFRCTHKPGVPPMDDRQAFMNAIIADIDNDLPRLVYADYLGGRGLLCAVLA